MVCPKSLRALRNRRDPLHIGFRKNIRVQMIRGLAQYDLPSDQAIRYQFECRSIPLTQWCLRIKLTRSKAPYRFAMDAEVACHLALTLVLDHHGATYFDV